MFGRKKTDNQTRISAFFLKPNPGKENVPAGSQTTGKAAVIGAEHTTHQIKPSAKKGAKPAWWTTPPKDVFNMPGARKRAADLDAMVPAKRTTSGSFEGRVKPLVRPAGMASSRASAQSSIVRAMLSDEQKSVLSRIVDQHQSVFFTGAAGTGKSHLLKQIVAALKRDRAPSHVAVVATTGLAAFNVGGKTLHRWAGIGLGDGSAPMLAQKIAKNGEAKRNWQTCRVLIIDEVSMLSADLLDKLEEVARLVRNSPQPFGGIQVVLTGDFFQLPPVSRGNSARLCFEANCWQNVVKHSIVLTKIFRQKDTRLAEMLNAMRRGNLTQEVVSEFEKLSRPVTYDDGLEPTELYPLRHQVEQANAGRMRALAGSTFVFEARDSSLYDSAQNLFEQLLAPKRLELKVGAQVLLIRNLTDQLVNGRRGQVVTFVSENEWTLLGAFLRSNDAALQVYNEVINRLSSEAGSIDAALQAQIDELSFPDEGTQRYYMKMLRSSPKLKLPVVDFRHGHIALIDREQFQADSGGRQDIRREQLPLVLSWALSIHKAQGQTLDRVIVDLSRVFEAGQAYVAVSRATSYARLQIRGFKKENVRVHPKVVEFYESIEQSQRNEATGLNAERDGDDLFVDNGAGDLA